MPQSSLLAFFQPVLSQPDKIISTECNEISLHSTVNTVVQPGNADVPGVRVEAASDLIQIHLNERYAAAADFIIPSSCPEAIICKLQSYHLPRIKQLTSTLLPVRYPDKFFDECVHDPLLAQISRVVIHDSKPVGWIRCRFEPRFNDTQNLYIQAIGVLGPWRGLGLATALVDEVTKPEILVQHKVFQIYAHVWQNNEDALEWYERRGFTKARLEPNYYRRLRPAGAWILQKTLISG